MNNFAPANPYTRQTPSGTLTNVYLTQPNHVVIQWPNIKGGGNVQSPSKPSIMRKIFG
jgi:hypothetical protein